MNSSSWTRAASRYATRGQSPVFLVPKHNRNDSVCWFIPAPAVIRPRSTPIRAIPTGCQSPIGERCCSTGLSYQPDAVIAIGDHVYWDLRSPVGSTNLGNSPIARKLVGEFARSEPILGTDNERKLKLVCTPQIRDLYGTMFRSTPVFFVQDDHDYFENDEATEAMVTFPPDDFMLRLARTTQALYYPEFLPDAGRPTGLPGSAVPTICRNLTEPCVTASCSK